MTNFPSSKSSHQPFWLLLAYARVEIQVVIPGLEEAADHGYQSIADELCTSSRTEDCIILTNILKRPPVLRSIILKYSSFVGHFKLYFQ